MVGVDEIVTLILCGGRGTRGYPHTMELPKPLLDVDGNPVLRHVMGIYATQGFDHFVLAAGFRPDLIAEFASTLPDGWRVEVADTGENTDKAHRIKLCRDRLGETFFVTYGDGVGNVDLEDLLAFHRSHNGTATVTVVPLPSQYGTLAFDGEGCVHTFREKPVLAEHWINAGFMVMDDKVFDDWNGEDLEGEILPALGAAGNLFAYRHTGFWKSMDTYKDSTDLTDLARTSGGESGRPPWMRSVRRASS